MTQRTLMLLRHGKSSWKDDTVDDFDRPLAGRGKRDGATFGRRLARRLPAPDLVLCSTARRARDTLAFLIPELVDPAVVHYEDGLYLASADALLARLRALTGDPQRVLLVGHNPGLTDLVNLLVDGATPAIANLPTFGVAIFTVTASSGDGPAQAADAAWTELAAGKVRLQDLLRPRDDGDALD
ncbi:MAG TPA: histidine phosphatase family protein [Pseudomonadales bacterium]|nr:histidine phosphatase family protein [Pseudomonadales bacterium]